jgi:hypothetical protein
MTSPMTDEELKALFETMRGQFDTSVEAMRREHEATRRHFDTAFESMNHEIRLVAQAVARFDEKLDRTTERLEQKIETSAMETRAMIQS